LTHFSGQIRGGVSSRNSKEYVSDIFSLFIHSFIHFTEHLGAIPVLDIVKTGIFLADVIIAIIEHLK
jgi:hypothetical protein